MLLCTLQPVSTSCLGICGAILLVATNLFFLRARGLRSADLLWLQGHAFEARVYAENPTKGFMPSPGTIASWRVPPGSVAFTHAGEVRVDSGVQQGDQVKFVDQSCFAVSSSWSGWTQASSRGTR